MDDGIHVWLASPLVQLAVVQDDLRHHVALRDRGILELAVCERIKEIINWSEYIRPRMLVSIVDIRWPIFQTKIKELTGVGLEVGKSEVHDLVGVVLLKQLKNEVRAIELLGLLSWDGFSLEGRVGWREPEKRDVGGFGEKLNIQLAVVDWLVVRLSIWVAMDISLRRNELLCLIIELFDVELTVRYGHLGD